MWGVWELGQLAHTGSRVLMQMLGFWLKHGAIFLAGIGLGWSDAEGSLLESRLACDGPPMCVCVTVPGRHVLQACAREAKTALKQAAQSEFAQGQPASGQSITRQLWRSNPASK